MATDLYYPYVTVEKVADELKNEWDTGICPVPVIQDQNIGTPRKSTNSVNVVITDPVEIPASTGTGYLGEIMTPFTLFIHSIDEENAQRIHYECRRIINKKIVTDPPRRGHWRVTGWPHDFQKKHYRFWLSAEEVLLNI